ncbi:hypothetical protein [Actinomyces bowdenii]|uniref:Uncharacterized protein n=1 Tax=Actinomyces bowdenii TaxID=131109 RepID=A0A853EII2_9ACTO|nr:hypothetical protein [Actinomyces bowdenii]MBF0696935.1 hypothetical protein [Actinomyces bowdenii]MCR2052186.1 hypothetical protein [Actinomyces bowdenii]NYS69108.1 hypothetical protein [Actinomyces bowdenii]
MSAQLSVRGQAGSVPLIRPVTDGRAGPRGCAQGAPAAPSVYEVVDGQGWSEDEAALEDVVDEAARAAQRERHAVDVAHLAHLIDDLLDSAGADDADRQAIAAHLTGGRRLELDGDRHDSWMLTTALAQAWHSYSQRAHLSAGALLSILDGACGLVTDYVDAEAVARILRCTQEEVTAEQVADLIQWLERGDVWDSNVTAEQIRVAWARYRDQRHESAGAA